MRFLWICLGGAVGTGARYAASLCAAAIFGTTFPSGTLFVNVVGSFLISAIMELSFSTSMISPTLRLALTTGVIGGFTTYSTFNYETLTFLRERAWAIGLANLIATVVLCFAAGVGGFTLVRALLRVR